MHASAIWTQEDTPRICKQPSSHADNSPHRYVVASPFFSYSHNFQRYPNMAQMREDASSAPTYKWGTMSSANNARKRGTGTFTGLFPYSPTEREHTRCTTKSPY